MNKQEALDKIDELKNFIADCDKEDTTLMSRFKYYQLVNYTAIQESMDEVKKFFDSGNYSKEYFIKNFEKIVGEFRPKETFIKPKDETMRCICTKVDLKNPYFTKISDGERIIAEDSDLIVTIDIYDDLYIYFKENK